MLEHFIQPPGEKFEALGASANASAGHYGSLRALCWRYRNWEEKDDIRW